ncbi:MAG: glycosyltransferase family 2 protein [Lachnospiraceae bacterium]|nr:glycosyltransferase family 2 protein [Lachnospiraceae bacterium]
MDEKILTVSIAAYNIQDYITETVMSILGTEEIGNNIEILIINDGSTDDTLLRARELAKRFPEIVRIIDKENGGWGSTVNEAISTARGKYLKLLDGDDWFITSNIKGFIRYLDECDSDLVITPLIKYFEKNSKEILCDSNSHIDKNTDIEESFYNGILEMHSICIRTECLRNNNVLLSDKCFYTDIEFSYYSIKYAKTISRYGFPIYKYRLGREGQSVSVEGIIKHYEDKVTVSKKLLEDTKCLVNYSGFKKEALIDRCRCITIDAYVAFCCVGDCKVIHELKEFDSFVKSNKDIDKYIRKSNSVRLLRLTHFWGFNITSKIIKNNFLKNISNRL